MRVGLGYDAHRLVAGRPLILGGVAIPYHVGLLGHSDADVLGHAIGDALLGAVGAGDLGRHFPDDDPAYKDISSLVLLAKIIEIVRQRGYQPLNLDATVVAQSPRLVPRPQKGRAAGSAVAARFPRLSTASATWSRARGSSRIGLG